MSANLESTTDTATEVDNAALSDTDTDLSLDNAASDDTADQVETQSDDTSTDTNTDEVIELSEFDDPLAEFEDKPLTRADIDKLYPRVSKDARDRLEKSETRLAATLTQIREIGGDQGVAFAKTVVPQLSNPNPSEQDATAVFDVLSEWNPALLASMGNLLLNTALGDERTFESTANSLVQEEFGDGVDLKLLHELVGWHKGGLFDKEAFQKAAEAQGIGKPTPYQEQQEKKIAELTEKLKSVEGKTSSAEQADKELAKSKSDEYVSGELMTPILPIAEKVGWVVKDGDKPEIKEAKLVLGEMVTAYLERLTRKSPEWRNYEHLRDNNQTFGRDGKPSRLMEVNVNPLKARSQALFVEAVRKLQPLINDTLRYKTVPRQKQITTSEAAPNGNKPKPAPTVVRPWTGTDPPAFNPENVNKAVQQFIAAKADAKIPVGQRGR